MVYIGLTGKNASGKGVVADYLKEKGFSYYSLSDAIRDELKKTGKEENRENLIEMGNSLRKAGGPGVLGRLIAEKVQEVGGFSVIDSIRNPKEVEELQKLDGFVLIFVDAPTRVRFDRAMERGRVENAETFEEFVEIEERENSNNPNAQQLNNTIALADKIIVNDSDIDAVRKKVDSLLDSM